MRISRLAPLALLLAGFAAPARAQSAGDGYLFGTPNVRLSIHSGYAHANAKSDLFDFAIQNLTLERGSFSGPSLGGDFAVRLAPRLDLSFGVDYSAAVKTSEDRRYSEGANNLPIEQTTSFRRVPLMANAVVYLAPRGRSVGTLAWIPARVVFTTRLESSGWAPAFQGLGGVDVTISPRLGFTADARYQWAKGDLSSAFKGFDRIDLSGITGSLGFTIRL
jgi:hypothetical protein